MGVICSQCGMAIDGEGIAFCPYCGVKLVQAEEKTGSPEAAKWIRKALAATSYPERKKILLQGLEACPGDREIGWELLFVGEPQKRRRGMDFSIIRCWVLDIYHKPGEFTGEERDRMREQLFDAPVLVRELERYEDPEGKQQEYLARLCREYLDIFLEGSNTVMGNLFGIQIGSNREKKLAVPVAGMIACMKADEKLSPEKREQLWKTMYQAYAAKTGGKTEYLDRMLVDRA